MEPANEPGKPTQSGGRIDRTRPLTFTYRGKTYSGLSGRYVSQCFVGQ